MSQLSFRHLWKALSTGTLVAVGLVLAGPNGSARAGPILDAVGDFLPTYTGPQNSGLDVVAHEVTLVGDRLNFFGRMAGAIAPTQAIGGLYLIGMDRGEGTPRFLGGTPIIGSNVLWDLIVHINPDGTGLVNNQFAGVVTPLNPADISINGNEFTANVPLSLLLPAATRPPLEWTYNLWPRNGVVIGQNVHVSDLAPDDGNALVQAIPEPASLWLLSTAAIMTSLLPARRRRSSSTLHTKKTWAIAIALSAAALMTCVPRVARADIYQWEYINPANPGEGKQPSTMLAPEGAGANTGPGANLSNRNLTMAYLIGANLYYGTSFDEYGNEIGYFAASNLTGTNLSQADLTNATLPNAYLTGANLTGAEVRGANFDRDYYDSSGGPPDGITLAQLYSTASYQAHDLTGIRLGNHNLTGVNLAGQNLTSATFRGATLTGANLSGAEVSGADFSRSWAPYSGADITGGITPAQLYSTASYQAHDLSGIGLGGNELAGANLTGQNLVGASFRGTSFADEGGGYTIPGANLTGANLSGADARGANFYAATLSGANLSQSNLTNANFSGDFVYNASTNLANANFSGADVRGASFYIATLSGANFTNADVRGADFSSASGFTAAQIYSTASYQAHNLTGIGLTGVNLAGANLAGQDLTNAIVFYATLSGANLSQANLTNVNFSTLNSTSSDLVGANLSQANLTNVNFSGDAYGANLTGANLSGADTHGANFYHATLSGANLSQTDLTNADFSGSLVYDDEGNEYIIGGHLTSANLSGADARGANFYLATLTGADTSNLIQSDGHIAGLDLTAGASLIVRDYDGNPAAASPTGPLPLVVEQHLAMNATGTLRLVFDADPWDSTISFATGIPVALAGTLELAFAPEVNLANQLGRTIDLFNWTGVTPTGAFTVSSPYTWDLSNLYTTGEVTLAALPALPGDFNGDSVVDAADLAQWNGDFGFNGDSDSDGDGDSDGSDFLAWQRQLGATPTIAAATTSVPEPATRLLVVSGAFAMMLRRRVTVS